MEKKIELIYDPRRADHVAIIQLAKSVGMTINGFMQFNYEDIAQIITNILQAHDVSYDVYPKENGCKIMADDINHLAIRIDVTDRYPILISYQDSVFHTKIIRLELGDTVIVPDSALAVIREISMGINEYYLSQKTDTMSDEKPTQCPSKRVWR